MYLLVFGGIDYISLFFKWKKQVSKREKLGDVINQIGLFSVIELSHHLSAARKSNETINGINWLTLMSSSISVAFRFKLCKLSLA